MHTAMPIRHSAMPDITALTEAIDRPIALVGMMGSGKSLVGRRLAQRLDLPFIDSDTEGVGGEVDGGHSYSRAQPL